MISVFFPGHSKDAAVNSVSTFISIFVPLKVSSVLPHGATLSVFACIYVVATWEDLKLIEMPGDSLVSLPIIISGLQSVKSSQNGVFFALIIKDAHSIL